MGFADEIRAFSVKCANNSDQVVRRTMFGIMESIDEMSPVGNPSIWAHPEKKPAGYVGGHFRSNWQLNEGAPPTGEIAGTAWQGALAREKAKIPAKPAGKVFYYGNTLPYAIPLEEGHSTQTPHGMVGLTAVKFGGIVDQAVAGVKK